MIACKRFVTDTLYHHHRLNTGHSSNTHTKKEIVNMYSSVLKSLKNLGINFLLSATRSDQIDYVVYKSLKTNDNQAQCVSISIIHKGRRDSLPQLHNTLGIGRG